MLEQDYVLEQTELLGRFLKMILYPGTKEPKPNFSQEALELQVKLVTELEKNNYNEAENLLFDILEEDRSNDMLRVGLWFYDRLSNEPREKLEKHGFSLDEVLEGMQAIEKLAMK